MRRALCRGRLRGPGNARRAFTLIELLVVIGIIVLLVSILAPAVMAAIRMAQVANSKQRLGALMLGNRCFWQENKYYPGQKGFRQEEGAQDPYTGSQQQAWDLFGPDLTRPNREMAPCLLNEDNRKSDLFDPRLVSPYYAVRNLPNSVSDRYRVKPMAILYFPSRLGVTGTTQYKEEDNAPYLVPVDSEGNGNFEGWHRGSFRAFIQDRRLGGQVPYKDGTFILLAAGMDRIYGTEDDLKNW